MKIAFVLWHTRETIGFDDDAKLIGVYSSEEAALAAKHRSALLPGFRDYLDGFLIDRYQVDHDNWTEGFGIEDEKEQKAAQPGATDNPGDAQ